MWLQRALAITKAHLRLCYSERRKSNLFFDFANLKVMFTWRALWFISIIKAGHRFISWYIFTDWISDYFTDSGLENNPLIYLNLRILMYFDTPISKMILNIGDCSISMVKNGGTKWRRKVLRVISRSHTVVCVLMRARMRLTCWAKHYQKPRWVFSRKFSKLYSTPIKIVRQIPT